MKGLNYKNRMLKRGFDLFFSFIGLVIMLIPILIFIGLATISAGKFGLFRQNRVGKDGRLFGIYKIRTMREGDVDNYITIYSDPRITGFGKFMRNSKLDEIPQLINVLMGDMSFVGPRPDVPGYADQLRGDDRIILAVRPGITGPATIKYRNEEEVLARENDPLAYNDDVIWKDKVNINKTYIENWSFLEDLKILGKTIIV